MMETDERLRSLEERVVSLESSLAAANTNTDQLRDLVVRLNVEHQLSITLLQRKMAEWFELLRTQKKWADAESDLLRDTRREMTKLRGAYYHVFPERLAQDVRVEEQIEALNGKPHPDAQRGD
jgi:hypothetical protein